jgi:hypothetical protein
MISCRVDDDHCITVSGDDDSCQSRAPYRSGIHCVSPPPTIPETVLSFMKIGSISGIDSTNTDKPSWHTKCQIPSEISPML